MRRAEKWVGLALASSALAAVALGAMAQPKKVELLGAPCATPPVLHCPDTACPADVTSAPGNVTEPKSGRKYFLDYPCDLKANEKVILVLSLHGGGSIANWQRNYFPLMDYKEKYRLVIATPSGSNNGWNPALDDVYLHDLVTQVEGAIGPKNIKAFWLAGHSLGGQTSNRLIMSDPFFRDRVDGWVSLSGGRLGNKREEVRATIPGPPPGAAPRAGGPPPGPPAGAAPRAGGPPGLAADASILPEKPFSFIYSSGEHELTSAGLPPDSKWAQKLKCGPQTPGAPIVDAKAGYVFDGRASNANPNPIWGRNPRPGTAKVYLYPKCADGRVVADVIRGDKGHTEGLEPKVTEGIIKMMVAAK
jgi:pimeloyl-ACP methyl ester carboxylesterase